MPGEPEKAAIKLTRSITPDPLLPAPTPRWTFDGLRSVLANSSSLAGLQIASILARIIIVAVLARAMGAQDYGAYAYALSITMVVLGLAMFGTNSVIVRELGTKEHGRDRLLGSAALLRAMTSLLAAGAALGWLAWSGIGVEMVLVSALFALGLVARSLAELFQSALTGFERSGTASQLGVARLFCELALVCVLAVIGAPIWAFAAAYVAVWTFQLVVSVRAAGPVTFDFADFKHRVRTLLTIGAPLGLTATCAIWLAQSPLILAEADGLAPALLGQLALAVQIIAVSRIAPSAIAGAAIPVLARSHLRGDGKDDVFYRLLLQLIWLAGGLAILLAPVMVPAALTVIFGDSYDGVAHFVASGTWLLLPAALLVAFESMALVRGRVNVFCAIICACALGVAVAGMLVDTTAVLAQAMLIAAAGFAAAVAIAALLIPHGPGWPGAIAADMSLCALCLTCAIAATMFAGLPPPITAAMFATGLALLLRRTVAKSLARG